MWGRIIEIMTAVWLGMSPFVFGVQSSMATLWADLGIALAICLCAGLSYWHPTRYAHLLIVLIAIGLFAWGRFANTPPHPIDENHVAVAIFLVMIAIVPNHASSPPANWMDEVEVKRPH